MQTKMKHPFLRVLGGPKQFWSAKHQILYLSSDKNISIIAKLYFDVIVRQVMALSLGRIIWYNFNGFLHVDFFFQEPFFPAKKLLDERWEEMGRGQSFLIKVCVGAKLLRLCFLSILRYEIQFIPVPEFGILNQFLRGSYTNWVLISTLHTHTQRWPLPTTIMSCWQRRRQRGRQLQRQRRWRRRWRWQW